MADREHLHALVDSLPEGALESAQTYLQAIQIWPPKEPEYPPEVQQHRKEMEAKRDKFLKGPASGTWAIDSKNKSHASFGTGEHNWETGEYTIRTFHVHYDFPMEITERIRLKDDQTLEYDFHISGLGNEHGFRVQFQANGG
ncbi:MAG: hypothetical protein DMG86_07125 [Acidobacteria bacterium]|nr:MAG: hypothetical protein DMG86_07125 [Acidobacteriota bacterium]PYX17308.1 MAG: hypothetical protein DMG84_04525 [Acidobacteriota bacterium]